MTPNRKWVIFRKKAAYFLFSENNLLLPTIWRQRRKKPNEDPFQKQPVSPFFPSSKQPFQCPDTHLPSAYCFFPPSAGHLVAAAFSKILPPPNYLPLPAGRPTRMELSPTSLLRRIARPLCATATASSMKQNAT